MQRDKNPLALHEWDVDTIRDLLTRLSLTPDFVDILSKAGVDGGVLLSLSNEDLQALGVNSIPEMIQFQAIMKELHTHLNREPHLPRMPFFGFRAKHRKLVDTGLFLLGTPRLALYLMDRSDKVGRWGLMCIALNRTCLRVSMYSMRVYMVHLCFPQVLPGRV